MCVGAQSCLTLCDPINCGKVFFTGIFYLPTSAGKESACITGDLGLIPELGRSPGEGNSYPVQYSGLEKSMDSIVHGVAESGTWLSDFHLPVKESNPLIIIYYYRYFVPVTHLASLEWCVLASQMYFLFFFCKCILMSSNLSVFSFIVSGFWIVRKVFPMRMVWKNSAIFSSSTCVVLFLNLDLCSLEVYPCTWC